MAENKKSFVLYADLIHTVKKMPSDKAGDLFLHILKYVNDENPVTDDMIVDLTFEPIKQQLKRDLKKWENYIEKQSENGKKGGRPKKDEEPKESQITQPFPEKPKKADNVSVSANVTENEKEDVDINNIDIATSIPDLNPAIHKSHLKECSASSLWLETVAMQNKITTEAVISMMDIFNLHLISQDKKQNTVGDYKSHFSYWLPKQDLSHLKPTTSRTNQIQKSKY